MDNKSHYEVTSADTKSIGFDYQYYYFLLQLLKLTAGQKIGLEVKDDIHIELPDGSIVLLQLKHSTQTTVSGAIQAIAERDIDLWKTIHNWIKIIQDPTEGRKNVKNQQEFIQTTTFILVSNKGITNRNNFFTKAGELNAGTITIEKFKEYLNKLLNDTEDTESNKDLRAYISELMGLNNNTLVAFIKKFQFHLNEDDLIGKIKLEILGYMIPAERVDDVYAILNSTLRDNVYLAVKDKTKIVITHDDFMAKYRNCFGRMKKLPRRQLDSIFPDDLNAQPFIQQLMDIGDVHKSEKEQILGYTKLRLLMYNNMAQWLHNGELTGPQKEAFEKICLTHWTNSFRSAHQKNRTALQSGSVTSTDIDGYIIEAANKCLSDLRKLILNVEDEELDIEISNGQFYQLANDLKIGWHYEWENKYKKS